MYLKAPKKSGAVVLIGKALFWTVATICFLIGSVTIITWLAQELWDRKWGAFLAVGISSLVVVEMTILWNAKELVRRKWTYQRKVIANPPGLRLLAIARFLYSPQTVELTFKVLIGDLQLEYFKALDEKKRVKPTYIRVKYFFLFLAAMGLSKLWSAVSVIKQVIK